MTTSAIESTRVPFTKHPPPLPPHATNPQLSDARWLVRLRYVAIAGQLTTLAILRLLAAPGLRVRPLLLIEVALLLSNIALWLLRERRTLRGSYLLAPVLFLDTIMLTALLAFSGGPMNPYTIFFLVHVVMAAVLLGGKWTWTFAAFCAACYASLFFLTPVSPHLMHEAEFTIHLYGMLSSFIVASLCVGYFVLLVQGERRRAENRATAALQAAANAESFASLTAIAAGAAHELATPLATIAVAARELERAASRPSSAGTLSQDIAKDARLIREEVDRCRGILDALSPHSSGGDEVAPISPAELVTALLDRLNPAAHHRLTLQSVAGPPVRLPRQRTAQAAMALLQNALDASAAIVVRCNARSAELTFAVDDIGPGMSPAVQARLGEPFFTTKPHGRGLGLFLVRQFVDHLAGRLIIASTPGTGTRVTMVLPALKDLA